MVEPIIFRNAIQNVRIVCLNAKAYDDSTEKLTLP